MNATAIPAPAQSALVIFIPEAESLIQDFRDRYDPSSTGIPAHVTLLYPFKPPAELTAEVLATLQELFSQHPGFTVTFQEFQEFPDVLYLAPSPAEPFRQLTELLANRYPETPPYGGAFTEIIPHLTLAQAGAAQGLAAIAAQFREFAATRLPIQARVDTISLLDNAGGHWSLRAQFPLGRIQPPG
ncbi:MAG: 2'-5' RNA ligase family protein [Anaerolineae bacterium]|jgi:2'-5' RNA ligase|nr:2'-5' RNA ligase family protein [Anaerolineae bacterium]